LFFSRRTFLQSLSRSAVVLSLDSVLGLALPRQQRASADQAAGEQSAKPIADLGVNFLNVAREAGLNAKTIFGGEHKNKYLLETTDAASRFTTMTTTAGSIFFW